MPSISERDAADPLKLRPIPKTFRLDWKTPDFGYEMMIAKFHEKWDHFDWNSISLPELDGPNRASVASVDHKLVEYFTNNPAEMNTMNRRLFEELVAEIWAGFGYEVELTKQTRDGGKDIVAIRRAHVNERFLIECKRPDPGNPVAIHLVRALYGVKHSEGATKAILATTSYVSPDAKEFFEMHKWELEGRDYDGILEWLKMHPGNGAIVLPHERNL